MKKFFVSSFIFFTVLRVVADPCNASFSYSTDGFTINLNGSASTGDVTHWEWYLNGDFFSDMGPENHYTVNEAGTYEICLIITTASACIDTVCENVVVESQQGDCNACFTSSANGLTIYLDGSCSTGDVTHWQWYINGELFSDAGPETHHTVGASGEYEICLVITTASGCIDTICQNVNVESQQGDCNACFTSSVDGLTIYLDGSCSTGDVTHWQWYINGELFSDAGPETHHTVGASGEYEICLVITTASGCIDTICQQVNVEEQQSDCEACFTYWFDGFTIHLNGACSTGDVIHWAWYINGDFFSDMGQENHYTVSEAGTYEICLIVTTASGCVDTACEEIHVEAQQGDCEACFTYWLDGLTIHLNGSCTSGDVVHWQWYSNGDLFSDAGPETHITVEEPGEYEICLIISTTSGCIDTICQQVNVEVQQDDCAACFTYWLDGLTIHLNGSCSTGDVAHWQWYINGDLFSDAGPETHTLVNHSGEYEICLIISTTSGCIDTICQQVNVEVQQNDCAACFTYWLDGLTIHLNGSCTTGDVAHWQWYSNGDLFSDAGPETYTTVDHSGEYEICLIISTASGCIDTICQHVNVEEQQSDCEACFTYSLDGLTIHLNGSCTTGDVAHWKWYINGDLFSDAGPETHTTVDHPGEYEICLIIETAGGCVDTFCDHITIEELQDGDYHFKASSPSSDENIVIQLSSPKDGFFTLFFMDVSGRIILEKTSDLFAGSSQYTLLVTKQIVPGCYFITLNFNNEVRRTNKVMIGK